jgi:paraquat-inducible protein B
MLPASAAPLPVAQIAPLTRNWWPWALPLAALLAVLWLLWGAFSSQGPEIAVRFDTGHGLRAGDPVRTRGIQVGVVERVQLIDSGRGVLVRARLEPSAGDLARKGTRLWIARPEIGPGGVSDLDTLVGPRYLALSPGAAEQPESHAFRGLERAPVGSEFSAGLEILLEAQARQGLAAGAALLYRQMPVGQVTQVALSADRSRVEVRVVVGPRYADLVRENSQFWVASGLELEAGLLDGLKLRIDSLEGLLSGAVAFATPNAVGGPAATGARFELLSEAPENALAWRPNLPLGSLSLPSGAALPRPRRTALAWKEGALIAFSLIGPRDLLSAPDDARAGSARLEVDGQELAVMPREETNTKAEKKAADTRDRLGGLLRLPLPADPTGWPAERERMAEAPEDLLVCGDAASGTLAIEAARLKPLEGARLWQVDAELAFDEGWHGAPVISRADGKLLGCLLAHRDGARIALLEAPASAPDKDKIR